MVRVLHVFHNMGNGGIENFVMNYYRAIDRTRVQFDFLTSVEEPGYFDKEIEALGGKLFHAFPKKKNPVKNYQSIRQIVADHHYDIVHRHTGSAIANVDLLAAKAGGAKTLISHSHSTQAGQKYLHEAARLLFRVDAEEFACSKKAGEWLFGADEVAKGHVHIIKNAIDTAKFAFSDEKRQAVRASERAADKLIVGHVGNFNDAKNHAFLVDVFCELQKQRDDAELWLIGDGVLRDEIEKKVASCGISDKVRFFGVRKDVCDLMQAMDVFLFPSAYEGFPVTIVEAQTAGLPCVVSSEAVPEDVNITGSVFFLSLTASAAAWANMISGTDLSCDRAASCALVRQAGYDIFDAAKDLEARYLRYAGE